MVDDINETVINAPEIEKQMDGDKETTVFHKKQLFEQEKQLFEQKKQLFEQTLDPYKLSTPTRKNIILLFEEVGSDGIFSRSEIKHTCDISDSQAGALLKKMKEMEIIEPIAGRGKGKFRFKTFD